MTLRYVYGIAHPRQIAGLVARYRAARAPLDTSERTWAAYLPKANFGVRWRWVAREILLYSVSLQPRGSLQLPYGTGPLCTAFNLGTSDDLDFWLILAASQYGLATRDASFFNRQVGFYHSTQKATVWERIKLAFQHQESLLGPHGGYLAGTTGDWSDLTPAYLGMTESMLVPAQTAYAYPRLARLADLRGDHAFAAQLRASAARDLATVRRQWTGRGWYARGYAGNRQLGQGAIFEEPQPWAILAGAPSRTQAITLLHNIRRFLDGVGAPAKLHGPTRIGTALSPSTNDPQVTERSRPRSAGVPDGHADYVGGVWYDVNGWLTWALGELDGVLPHANQLAWSEYTRNTLAAHANAFPDHWARTISVDDACYSYYARHPDYCGAIGNYDGQITEQPTWMVMDAINLAGITPTEHGYTIAPHLPFKHFSLRLPEIGIASEAQSLRGYLTTQSTTSLRLTVKIPAGVSARSLVTWADRRRVRHGASRGAVSFRLLAVAGHAANWALTWSHATLSRDRIQ